MPTGCPSSPPSSGRSRHTPERRSLEFRVAPLSLGVLHHQGQGRRKIFEIMENKRGVFIEGFHFAPHGETIGEDDVLQAIRDLSRDAPHQVQVLLRIAPMAPFETDRDPPDRSLPAFERDEEDGSLRGKSNV